MSIEGKVAIITGASRGIGKALAIELGRRGVSVVVAARSLEPHRRLPGTIGETVEAVEAAGGRAVAVQTDLTDLGSLPGLVEATLEAFGRIDFLVNNGADTRGENAPVETYPLESWLRQFASNVHAPFVLSGLVAPHLRSQGGGVIVNVTSGAAMNQPVDLSVPPNPLGSLVGYAATKAALDRMANAIAPELARDNVAVVQYSPPPTRTEYMDLLIERGLFPAEGSESMDVPVQDIIDILNDENPVRFAGQIVMPRPMRPAAFTYAMVPIGWQSLQH
jgi:NAD(P)-dependent dehydrogenase (short-subunit alcohol dehydrogenase family)